MKQLFFKFKNCPKCFTAYDKTMLNTRYKNHFVLLLETSSVQETNTMLLAVAKSDSCDRN